MPDSGLLLALPNLWLSLLSIALLHGIALYAWRFRKEPGALWQCGLQASKALMLCAVLLQMSCLDARGREFWAEFYLIFSFAVCYTWLRFIAALSGDIQRLPRMLLPVIHGTFLLLTLLVATNSWHHWLWRGVWIRSGSQQCDLEPLGYAPVLGAYAMGFYALGLNLRWAFRLNGLRRRQAWMFLLPSVAALAGQMANGIPHPAFLEPQTVGFMTASLLMGWAFHRWRAYSVLPLARKVVADSLIDGLVVIDEAGAVVDLNRTARQLFAADAISVGSSYAAVLGAWPALEGLKEKAFLRGLVRVVEGERRYYEVREESLRSGGKAVLGRALVFRNMSLEYRQQEHIVEQQRALAVLEEREKLGRELHDGPGQLWSFLAAQTQAARLHIGRERYAQADRTLEQLQQIVREHYTGLRESITSLQTSTAGGLIEALGEQLRWYRECCGIEATLEVDSAWRRELLAPDAEPQVLRILQEALVNVRKSARAHKVRVRIGVNAGDLIFRIEDDGQGFDLSAVSSRPGRYGLRIMKERAAAIGGSLSIDSRPWAGCRVELVVPVQPMGLLVPNGMERQVWVQ